MATTFNFELNNRPSKNKTFAIQLRITQNKKHKRTKTSIELKNIRDFNPKAKQGNWIRTSEPNFKIWNAELERELEKAKQTYRDLKVDGLATKEKIISTMVSEEKTASFIQYAKNRAKEILDSGGFRNWKKYHGFCNKLEAFLRSKNENIRDLTFAELTPSLLVKFENYLRSLPNERQPDKKLHPNTIVVNFNIFKTLVNRAIAIDNYLKIDKNPFNTFSYKGVKTTKEKLNDEEISALETLPLQVNTPKWHSRNYFLFSLYCAGIRVGDFIQLRWSNIVDEERLVYQMDKNHKIRDIKLIEKAKKILALYCKDEVKSNDYIFPLLDSSAPYAKASTQREIDTMSPELKVMLLKNVEKKTSYINKYLSQVSKDAGITKKISFHIARHTFARIAKNSNIDNAIVQGILAHENSKTTDVYMGHFETSVYDNALDTIFDDKKKTNDITKLMGNATTEQLEAIRKILQSNG